MMKLLPSFRLLPLHAILIPFRTFAQKKGITLTTAIALIVLFVGLHQTCQLSGSLFMQKNSKMPSSIHSQASDGFLAQTTSACLRLMPGPSSSHFKITFEELVQRSQQFESQQNFPTEDNRFENLVAKGLATKTAIVEHANAARPILHEKVLSLIEAFLNYKKSYGSSIEKRLYQAMDKQVFIDRLLVKRPLAFFLPSDSYLLRDGKTVGAGGFENIGTELEKQPLCLNDYLSYDEMQISAFLGVSVPTYFINNGNRYNRGVATPTEPHEETGLYIGLVGARFEAEGRMEWQHMMITPTQNTAENGYGTENRCNPYLKIWSDFYGCPFPTFKEAESDKTGKYILVRQGTFLNSEIYKKRMQMVIEPFLAEANQRASEKEKKAYVHAVGLGLGVWAVSPAQAEIILDAYAEVLSNRPLPFIADIDFSWFPASSTCGGVAHLEVFRDGSNEITFHFSRRNPADKLMNGDTDKYLVASYAWDSNSYPGNEYWQGHLHASGDPAAACCSTIPQLQNPLINHSLSSKKLFVVKTASKL